jgi:hypothetical protein
MKALLVAIIEAVLHALIPALAEAAREKSEDAARQSLLRERLKRRVRRIWGHVGLCLCAALILCSCATQTVYVPYGEPVRLRETVRGAKVWVLDGQGRPTAGVMDLPEGWYCLPDEGND